MPCFTREKSLSFRPRRDKTNDRDAMAPRPVHPRAMKYHGLLGMSLVRQHMIVDERWTPDSLAAQYVGFTDLLSHRVVYKRHETKANRRKLLVENKRLKLQCADGRTKLHKIKTGHNAHKIRNFLINHRDMQRLYQKMPIHLVVDNINQRTFVLRKERDRLEFLLGQRKHELRELLLDKGELENHISYANEFVLEEELKSRILLKKIENSNVRLKAIRTINITYKKMVQVLLQDEIFYEPILRSLDDDMEDQSNFIKHILYLGTPAIAKFKELNQQYRNLEEKSRKSLHAKIEMLTSLLNPAKKKINLKVSEGISPSADPKRYVRETNSMTTLKNQLSSIEGTIKTLKMEALCSQAKEIYPRLKSGWDNNIKVQQLLELKSQNHEILEMKMKYTNVFHGVLINNLSEEEINRLERVSDLRKTLEVENQFEQDTFAHMKNRADIVVMFRISLWNILDILRHVDRVSKQYRTNYPNSYLKLPLLKFEMMHMFAPAPLIFEEDIEKLMLMLKRKVYKLIKGYKAKMKSEIKDSIEKYHTDYLDNIITFEYDNVHDHQAAVIQEDLLQEQRTNANIPSRKQIKALSAKTLEQAVKNEEQ